MSRFAVLDPETGDWIEVTEEGIRLGLGLLATRKGGACNPPTTHRYERIGQTNRLRCYRCWKEREA